MKYHQILSTFDGNITRYHELYKILIERIQLLDNEIKYMCDRNEDNRRIVFLWNNIQCSIVFGQINVLIYIFVEYTDEVLQYIDFLEKYLDVGNI